MFETYDIRNERAEQLLLAGIVAGGDEAFARWRQAQAAGGIRLLTGLNLIVWEAVQQIVSRGAEIFPASLEVELQASGQAQHIPDAARRFDELLSQREFETALGAARDALAGRDLREITTRLQRRLEQPDGDYLALMGKVYDTVRRFYLRAQTDEPTVTLAEAQRNSREYRAKVRRGEIRPIVTGYEQLDAISNGISRGELLLIGGNPSAGKTSLMANLIDRIGVSAHQRVLVGELEMPNESIADKINALRTGISAQKYRRPMLMNETQWEWDGEEVARCTEAPVRFLHETWNLTPEKLLLAIEHERVQGRAPDLVMVDYLSLMQVEEQRLSRAEAINKAARALKRIALETGVAMVVLAGVRRDFGRASARESNQWPTMYDIEYGGEKHADAVWMLHYNPEQMQRHERLLAVCKNRFGVRDQGVWLDFDPLTQQFTEAGRPVMDLSSQGSQAAPVEEDYGR